MTSGIVSPQRTCARRDIRTSWDACEFGGSSGIAPMMCTAILGGVLAIARDQCANDFLSSDGSSKKERGRQGEHQHNMETSVRLRLESESSTLEGGTAFARRDTITFMSNVDMFRRSKLK